MKFFVLKQIYIHRTTVDDCLAATLVPRAPAPRLKQWTQTRALNGVRDRLKGLQGGFGAVLEPARAKVLRFDVLNFSKIAARKYERAQGTNSGVFRQGLSL
jgi:hypothetical protein